MSSTKRKSYTPIQTKSLEQIFPADDGELNSDDRGSTRDQTTQQKQTSAQSNANNPTVFVPEDLDIIDVEREIKGKNYRQQPRQPTTDQNEILERTLVNAHRTAQRIQPAIAISPPLKKELRESIDLPEDGSYCSDAAPSDPRLQVIMQFVKDSPSCPARGGQTGRKSSLTDIIDAVTQRVKEDPSLAKTLTEAINSAAATEQGVRRTRQASRRVRQSASLPSVLDGLVTRVKKSAELSSDVLKIKPISKYMDKASETLTRPPTITSTEATAQLASTIQTTSTTQGSVLVNGGANPPVSGNGNVANYNRVSSSVPSSPRNSVLPNGNIAYTNSVPSVPSFPYWTKSETAGQQRPSCNQSSLIPDHLNMARAQKRRHPDSLSQGPNKLKPRKKFVMTESSYKHMVEIIDEVANGRFTYIVSSKHSDEDVRSMTSSDTSSQRGSSSGRYDFMIDSRDSLDFVRTCETDSERPQPLKNMRLASIINKLSTNKDESATATSPTGSTHNQGSVDSGFVSLAE